MVPFLSQLFWVEQNYRSFCANADFLKRDVWGRARLAVFRSLSLR